MDKSEDQKKALEEYNRLGADAYTLVKAEEEAKRLAEEKKEKK